MQRTNSEKALLQLLKDIVFAMESGDDFPADAMSVCVRKRNSHQLTPNEQEMVAMIERLVLAQRTGVMNPPFYEAVELIVEITGEYP